jgi:hypothetical protein
MNVVVIPKGWGWCSMVGQLPSMCKALHLIPALKKIQERNKERKERREKNRRRERGRNGEKEKDISSGRILMIIMVF